MMGVGMDDRTTVLVHCCNRLLRELITRLLGKRPEFEVEAYDVQVGRPLGNVPSSRADVVVLDSLELYIEGAGANCAKAVRQAAAKYVLVAMEDDHAKFLSAVRLGALGYVLQDASAADVVAAIRTVARGQASCPPAYSRVLFDCVAGRGPDLPASRRAQWGLTRREQQLIPLIGRGLTNKEIAAHFSLSERTIKNHIHRILKKVGASDRLGLYEVWQSQLAVPGGSPFAN
jgi:two-component system, NarL family, response regulator DevR